MKDPEYQKIRDALIQYETARKRMRVCALLFITVAVLGLMLCSRIPGKSRALVIIGICVFGLWTLRMYRRLREDRLKSVEEINETDISHMDEDGQKDKDENNEGD